MIRIHGAEGAKRRHHLHGGQIRKLISDQVKFRSRPLQVLFPQVGKMYIIQFLENGGNPVNFKNRIVPGLINFKKFPGKPVSLKLLNSESFKGPSGSHALTDQGYIGGIIHQVVQSVKLDQNPTE